jgi:hypothetical protein
MKYFAGLDLSLEETAICIVDEDGIASLVKGRQRRSRRTCLLMAGAA